MVQKPKNRRSKPTREPVTLDLKANEVTDETGPEIGSGQTVPPAEPVAFEFGRDAGTTPTPTTADTIEESASQKSPARAARSSNADVEARGAIEGGDWQPENKPDASAATESSTEHEAKPEREEVRRTVAEPVRDRTGSGGLGLIGAGIVGGIVAIIIAAILQWAGIIPAARQTASPNVAALQAQVDSLSGDVREMQSTAPAQGSGGGDVESLMSSTEANSSALETLQSDLASLDVRVSSLAESVASGGGGAEGGGLDQVSSRIGELETRIADLSSKIDSLQNAEPAVDPAALDAIRSDVASASDTAGAAQQAADGLRSDLDALGSRVDQMEEDIQSGAGNRVAAALAASSLKSAADRGRGFMSELEAYAEVADDQQAVDALRDYAPEGVPTATQLSERFPSVANDIVSAASGVGPEAGIGQRLMASARSLVQVRPVGEVEGDEPGAITARMEVALTDGDLDRVVTEWEKLPEESRQVSQDFIADVKARRELDQLISNVLSGAVQPDASAAEQPAAE